MIVWRVLFFLVFLFKEIFCFHGTNDLVILGKYVDCCEFMPNPSELQQCVTELASIRAPQTKDIIFMTFISKEIHSYSAYFTFFNQFYFIYYDVPLIILSEETGDDYFRDDRRWNKVKALANGLHTWGKDCKYLIYLDADILLSNPSVNISEIIRQTYAENPQTHVIMSEDLLDYGNSGVLIVENHPWSLFFLNSWLEMKSSPNTFCDQHVLNRLSLSLLKNDSIHHVTLLPFPVINSKFPAIENYPFVSASSSSSSSPWLIHFLGEYSDVRERIGRSYAKKLCKLLKNISLEGTKGTTESNEINLSGSGHFNFLNEFLAGFPTLKKQELVKLKTSALTERIRKFQEIYENRFDSNQTHFAFDILDSFSNFCKFQMNINQEYSSIGMIPMDRKDCEGFIQQFSQTLGNSMHFHFTELQRTSRPSATLENQLKFFSKLKVLLSFYDLRISLVVLKVSLTKNITDKKRLVLDEISFFEDIQKELLSLKDSLANPQDVNKDLEYEKEKAVLFMSMFTLEKRIVLFQEISSYYYSKLGKGSTVLAEAISNEQVVISDIYSLLEIIQKNLTLAQDHKVNSRDEQPKILQLLFQEHTFNYITSAMRLTCFYVEVKQEKEAIEWCDIARNNILLLQSDYIGEDRLIVTLQRDVLTHCVQAYSLDKDDVEKIQRGKEFEEQFRASIYRAVMQFSDNSERKVRMTDS
jgi:hypothetical protein